MSGNRGLEAVFFKWYGDRRDLDKGYRRQRQMCIGGRDSVEYKYLKEKRNALGGPMPIRTNKSTALDIPEISIFQELLDGTGEREISTTMAYVRLLTLLTKDKSIGKHVVPIIPDEARTFGMDPLFRQLGIYSHNGQLYD